MLARGPSEEKLRLRFGEQLPQARACFSRVTVKLQKFLIMPNIEADDLRILRHCNAFRLGVPELR